MTDDIEIDKELAKKTLRIYRDMNDGKSIPKIMDDYNITSDEFKDKKLGSPASQRAAAKLADYPGSWSYLFHKYKLDKHGNIKERKIISPPAKKRKFNGVNFKRRNRSGMTKKQAEKYVKPLKDKFYYRIIEEDNKQWVYVRSKSASMKPKSKKDKKDDKKEKKVDKKDKKDDKKEKKVDKKEKKVDKKEKKVDEEKKKEVKVKISEEDGDVVTIEGAENRRIIIEPEIEDKEELEEVKKELEKEMGEKASFKVETDEEGKPRLYTDAEEPVETDVTIISRPQGPPETRPQEGQEFPQQTHPPTQPIPPGGFPQPDTGKMEGIPLDEKYKEGEEPTEGRVKPVEAPGVAPKKGKPGKSVEPMEVRTKQTPTQDISNRLKEIEERERAIEREAERGELRKDIEKERQALEEEKQKLGSAQGITETEQKYKQEIDELKQKINELKSDAPGPTQPRGEIRTLGMDQPDVEEEDKDITPEMRDEWKQRMEKPDVKKEELESEEEPPSTTETETTTTSEGEPPPTAETETTTTSEEELPDGPIPDIEPEWEETAEEEEEIEDGWGDEEEEELSKSPKPTTHSQSVTEEDTDPGFELKRARKVVAARPEEAEIETGEERKETENMFNELDRTSRDAPPDTDEVRVRCPVCQRDCMVSPDEIENATCRFCGARGVVREGVIYMKSPWTPLEEPEPPEYTVPPQTQSQAPMDSKKDEEGVSYKPELEAQSQAPMDSKKDEEGFSYEPELEAQSQAPMDSKKDEEGLSYELEPEDEKDKEYGEKSEVEDEETEEDRTDEIEWNREVAQEWEMPDGEDNGKIYYRYKCSNCGEIVEEDDEFCESCGKKFDDVIDKEDYIDFEIVEEYMGGNDDNTAVKIREKIIKDGGGRELDVRVKKQVDKLWKMMDNYVENSSDKNDIITQIKDRMDENERRNPETSKYFEMGIVDGVDVAITHIHEGIYGIISTASRDEQRNETRFNNKEFNDTVKEDDNVTMKQATDAYNEGFAEGYTSDEVKNARIKEIEEIELPDTKDNKCVNFQAGKLGIDDDDEDKRWYITIKSDGRVIANPELFTKEDCAECYGDDVDDYWYYELEWDPDKDDDGGYNAQNGWDKPYCHQLGDKKPKYEKTYENPPSPTMDPIYMHQKCRELHNQIQKLESQIKMYTPKKHMHINRTMACQNIPYIANNEIVLKICGEGIRRFNMAQDNRYEEKVDNTRDELEAMQREKRNLQRELNRCNSRYPPGQGITDEDIEIEDMRDQALPEVIDQTPTEDIEDENER